MIASSPLALQGWVQRLLGVLALVMLLMSPAAHAQAGGKNFDHTRTGFILEGLHARERCESCHINGVFRGTPRDCATCHTSGTLYGRGNTTKSATHIPTRAACDTCHTARSFSGARFTHTGVTPGSCQSCHNGSTAPGKSANHIATTASCDSCHRTGAWLPAANFDHAGVQPGTCATCHNGSRATGRSARHIPYSTVSTIGNPGCDSCHKAGFRAWLPARLHSSFSVTTQCASCHTGGYGSAVGKPNNATHATATVCETCHKSTSVWSNSTFVHAAANAIGTGTCDTCHNGSTAKGKTPTHIPVNSATSKCDSCHRSQAAFATAITMNHSAVSTTACASCHTGTFPPADGKPATHIPYTGVTGVGNAACDSCHKAGTATWTPARFHGSFSVSAQCATCHTGTYGSAAGKPNNATHATATVCETCHKSTSVWSNSTFVHAAANAIGTGTCDTCHNGSTAKGKTPTHIPVNSATSKCDSCHRSQAAFATAITMNHSAVSTTACASCHTGTFPPADGKPATHIPYTGVTGVGNAACDSCHKAGTATWTPARFHGSFSVSAQCASCHTGTYSPAVGKPNNATHAGVTTCEGCHKTTAAWTANFTHSAANAIGTGTCDTCHNGSTAKGKTPTHIPVNSGTTKCDSCHRSQASFATAMTMNHSVVSTTACASCHTGAYTRAIGKPATHVPYVGVTGVGNAACDSCHKAGTASWTPARFHGSFSVSAQCATCHTGTYSPAVGKPNNATHVGVTVCETCHKTTAAWTANFAHSAANAVGTGTCDTCHNGSTARGKTATHIPVNSATSKCDSCHRSQASFATAMTMNHSVVSTSTCKSCHGGSYVSQGATAKPSNHIPEGTQLLNGSSMDCNTCHTVTTSWTSRMNHNSTMGNGAGWCKGCHQSGTAFLGGMEKKSLTHERSSPLPTDCSQSGCHRPLGNKGAAYTKWD